MNMAEKWERARRGEKVLDEKKPGWEWSPFFDKPDDLDIGNANACVLHGVYETEAWWGNLWLGRSGYVVGCEDLGLGGKGQYAPVELGFTGGPQQTEVWRQIIAEKREKTSGYREYVEALNTLDDFLAEREELTTA